MENIGLATDRAHKYRLLLANSYISYLDKEKYPEPFIS